MKKVKYYNGPLFIIGMPRSGTKLVRSILNQHSNIRLTLVETEFLPYWVRTWHRFGDLSDWNNFRKFYFDSIKLPYFIYMKDYGRLINCHDWYSRCKTFDVAGVFEALIKYDTMVEKDSEIWGDKSPSYIRHTTLIKHLFPEAKFIHIIRDVRDYCLSVNYAWGKNMIRAAQRWADNIRQCRRESKAFNEDYLEILYEDLLSEPEIILKTICDFLGVDYEPDMLKLSQPTEYIGCAKGYIGIYSKNKKKYINQLDKRTRLKIESITVDLLRDLGYEVEFENEPIRVSSIKMKIYQILDGINTLRFYFNERGLFDGMIFWSRRFLSSGERF